VKRVVEVALGEESLAVTYDRDALLRATADAAPTVFLEKTRFAQSQATIDVLAEAIVSWNLFDDDGRPYPTDRESLSDLPLVALYKIAQAIETDAVN
jgi:hypothetical protein